MTSYHHHYPSTQVSLGFGAAQPYRSRASDFWYKLAWLSVGLLALLVSAFSLYRNGILLKFARDWGAEQTYISIERSLLGGPYWGAPSFEMPMAAVAELATTQFASAIAAPASQIPATQRVVLGEAPAPSQTITTTSAADSELAQDTAKPSLDGGIAVERDSRAPRAFVDRSPAKVDAEPSTRSETKALRGESAKPAAPRPSRTKVETGASRPHVEVAAKMESASSTPHAEATAQKESAPSKRSAADAGATKHTADSSATSRTAEPSTPSAAAVSKPAAAPARKMNPLDAAIRAAIGK